MEFETNESSLLYLTNTISRTSAELQTCASGEPSVRPCPEPLRVSPVHYTQLICPDLDLSVSLSPAPPTDRRNRQTCASGEQTVRPCPEPLRVSPVHHTLLACPDLDLSVPLSPAPPTDRRHRQVRFAMTPHISQLQCDPVTSQSNQPEGAELNTSLAYKAELQEVEEKQFDPEEAVKNRLQSSAFTKNHVELRASAGVNIPRCQQQYRELVSVDLSNDQLLERALQERPPLTSHSVSNGQKPLEAPDPMHFFSSHKMIRETLLLPGDDVSLPLPQTAPRPARTTFHLHQLQKLWES